MATYFNTGPLPFAPAVKVKPLARCWDSHFREWRVKARVTSRRETYTGEKCGAIVYARPGSLYATQGVQRGKCGRLYWSGPMPDAEFMALPVSDDLQG
jgi:hypothetical protein